MKNTFSILKISLLLFFCGNMTAQTNFGSEFTSALFQVDEHIKRQDKFINYEDTKNYTGTPYNHPSYLLGNVYKDSELLANNVALRYNAVADEMEIKEGLTASDDEAKVLTKSPEIFVKIGTDIYIFAPYKGGVEDGGYFQVIHEGTKIDLYKKLKKKFRAEQKATTSITRDIPAKFSDDVTYFLGSKDGKFYELPNSRGKKIKVFGKNKNDIKKYAQDNKLDINTEKDLLKIVKFYDTKL